MGQAIDQSGCQFFAKSRWPFREAEMGRDNEAGALVQFADQVKQQGAPGSAKSQIAEFIEDTQVGLYQLVRQAALPGRVFPALRY